MQGSERALGLNDFSISFLFVLSYLCVAVCICERVCACECGTHGGQRQRMLRILWSWRCSCELLGAEGYNSGPLQKQHILSPAEPSPALLL